MKLSPLAERLLRHRRDLKHRRDKTAVVLAMETGDQSAIVSAIGDNRIFAKMSESVRAAVVEGTFKIALARANDELAERHLDPERRNRDVLLSHLPPILKILDDDVGALDAADMLLPPRGDLFAAVREVTKLKDRLQRLLDGARDFYPWPSRRERRKEPFNSERDRQALLDLIELLGSAGVHVRASSGRKTELLASLYGYATGDRLTIGTVKNLVLKNKYKPD